MYVKVEVGAPLYSEDINRRFQNLYNGSPPISLAAGVDDYHLSVQMDTEVKISKVRLY